MGKQIQFTKKDAYHTPGKAKRERIKVTTIQKAHLLKKFSNVLRDNKDGISFWFNTERFMTTARRYNFVASSILRDIELSEYIEEDELNEKNNFVNKLVKINDSVLTTDYFKNISKSHH